MAGDEGFILNDVPVVSVARDGLDFGPYVRALAQVMRTGGTPLTIGVFGTWGSGKTSLMRMLQETMQAQGAVTGWFDAWKYDKEETLWRAFLLATLKAVRAAALPDQPTQDLDYLETMLYRAIDLERAGGVTIDLAKLGGKLAQGAVQIGLSFIPGGPALAKIVEELQKAGTGNLTESALDAIQQERAKIHIEQVHFLEQFQDKFSLLVKQHVTDRGRRLVIFVDDLDRCLPEKAIEVLEAIKLFVDAPGCVFVLGLDQDVIARGVELRYHEFAKGSAEAKANVIDGTHYLEKIIQLPFHIPPVEETEMQKFVSGLAREWPHADCCLVFAQGLGNNPRQIKRSVNVFFMLWTMAEMRKARLQGAIKPVRLAKVVALQTAAPVLYALLKDRPGLLRDIELYYQAEHQSAPGDGGEGPMAAGRKAGDRPELPQDLARLVDSIPAVKRILTIRHERREEMDFGGLSPVELQFYFTLTRSAEALKSAAVEAASLPFEPQMVRIPAGKFQMGTSVEQAARTLKLFENDKDLQKWIKDEQPSSELDLPEYLIGKYPITNQEYKAFVQDKAYDPPSGWAGDSYPDEKGEHPVVNVSWDDAMAYCQWLSEKTGKPYGLPSEAEWEKAARGSDGRLYPWGDELPDKTRTNIENWFGGTTPVGQFSLTKGDSPYGCADMAGNVWEWTRSIYKPYPYQPDDGREQPDSRDVRVLRGGAFYDDRRRARCAFRAGVGPAGRDDRLGFRVCVVSPILNSEL